MLPSRSFTTEDRARWGEGWRPNTGHRQSLGLMVGRSRGEDVPHPSAEDLDGQMSRQSTVILRWVDVLGLPKDRVRHVLLLPRACGLRRAWWRW